MGTYIKNQNKDYDDFSPKSKNKFDIHEFIAAGLKIGLQYSDIKEMYFLQLYNLIEGYKGRRNDIPTQEQIDFFT